jgi:starch-binding outer membrane protein, SusD/RagB family
MSKHSIIRVTFLLLSSVLGGGCHKSFLDQKPSTDLLIPNTMPVLQQLMDNTLVMNISPALGEFSADNFYLTYLTWSSLDIKEANAYIWASDIYEGQGLVIDWDIPCQQVFYSNTVLQGLAGIRPDSTNQTQWNTLEGTALFSRAFAFFNVAELFAKPYDTVTAASDPGIPIRLNPDINEKTTRASMQVTYNQILGDLHTAEGLLPAAIPFSNLNRPSRLAVQALLARVYLSVGDYTDAGLCADSVLNVYGKLLNYNILDTLKPIQFAINMPEVLYQANFPFEGNTLQAFTCNGCLVDTTLIASYAANDLRRPLYYFEEPSGLYTLNGSYAGLIYPFSGLATDELYLIRAECNARGGQAGQVTAALNDLDTLMSYRVVTGSFTPYAMMSAAAALDTVLAERRKELAFRGIRWSDLRRLNQEGWNITLTRNLNGIQYTLPFNSELYTLPIPPDVIQESGIAQNPR